MRGPVELPPARAWRDLIERALEEDVGPGDVTTALLVSEERSGEAVVEAREPLVVCGLAIAEAVFQTHHPGLALEHCAREGRSYDEIEKTVHMPIVTHGDPDVLARVRAFAKEHYDLTDEQVASEIPVGTAAHVRGVLERYVELGVEAILMPMPGPWDLEVLRRLDQEVLRAF